MKITINGKEFTDGFNADGSAKPLEGKARLKWSDIAMLAGIPTGPRGKWTNQSTVTVQSPGDATAKSHLHGFSLILVDGMTITAQP